MSEERISYCKFCESPVEWITTAKNGKKMPVDPEPIKLEDLDENECFFDEGGKAWFKNMKGAPPEGRVSHFGSCEARKIKEAEPAKKEEKLPEDIDDDQEIPF